MYDTAVECRGVVFFIFCGLPWAVSYVHTHMYNVCRCTLRAAAKGRNGFGIYLLADYLVPVRVGLLWYISILLYRERMYLQQYGWLLYLAQKRLAPHSFSHSGEHTTRM